MTKDRITPTPEYMEALGRAEDKHGKDHSTWEGDPVRQELALILEGDSILNGIVDEQEKHNAVGARWPHLYTTGKSS
jgi:hypothetical protein